MHLMSAESAFLQEQENGAWGLENVFVRGKWSFRGQIHSRAEKQRPGGMGMFEGVEGCMGMVPGVVRRVHDVVSQS